MENFYSLLKVVDIKILYFGQFRGRLGLSPRKGDIQFTGLLINKFSKLSRNGDKNSN
jgi:hypothetical protein